MTDYQMQKEARARMSLIRYHRNKTNPDWLQKHRERNTAHMRKRRMDPEIRKKQALSTKHARQRDVLPFLVRAARYRAKKRGLPFELTVEWARGIWTGRCAVTGIAFRIGDGCQTSFSPSIDKIVPELGYTPSNSRFVLAGINSLKGNGTDEDVRYVAAAIVRGTT